MHPLDFLTAELHHAQRQLARLRRIQAKMQHDLEQAGLDEVTVYERLAAHKAYRQLQRDEVVFQQMWLRVHRQLERLVKTKPAPAPSQSDPLEAPAPDTDAPEAAAPAPPPSAFDEVLREIRAYGQTKPQPFRKPPTPGRNEPCSCGSGLKYKRCCGNSLRQQAA